MRTISALFTYPLKSGAGIAHQSCKLLARGLEHDRRWMVVDADGEFVTQRTHPMLATVVTTFNKDGTDESVSFSSGAIPFTGCDSIRYDDERHPARQARVWGTAVDVVDQGDDAARWFSSLLDKDVRLVYQPETSHRPTKRDKKVEVGLADGYPLLVATQESLDDLNGRMEIPVGIERFRPNVVVSGCIKPYEEDRWDTFWLGRVQTRGMKPCLRCPIIQIDQSSGTLAGREPAKTLLGYRSHVVVTDKKRETKTWFGLNANHQSPGVLSVGDRVIVSLFADISF